MNEASRQLFCGLILTKSFVSGAFKAMEGIDEPLTREHLFRIDDAVRDATMATFGKNNVRLDRIPLDRQGAMKVMAVRDMLDERFGTIVEHILFLHAMVALVGDIADQMPPKPEQRQRAWDKLHDTLFDMLQDSDAELDTDIRTGITLGLDLYKAIQKCH